MPKFKVGDFIFVLKAWNSVAVGKVYQILEHCAIDDDEFPYRVRITGNTKHTWVGGIRATELLKALI